MLIPAGAVGIELGVAEGRFAERILRRSQISHLYGVDMWSGDRNHDLGEYKRAFRRLLAFPGRSSLIRLRFDDAVDMFEDEFFDFIYVDGYAHTGEEDGETFEQWWPKLKPGGIFSGDDYHPDWPKTVSAVDHFVAARRLNLHVIDCVPLDDWASQYPTWIVFKPMNQ